MLIHIRDKEAMTTASHTHPPPHPGTVFQSLKCKLMPKNLSQQTTGGQFVSILGVVAVMVTLFGGITLLAADKVINDKYASDADLKAVQEVVQIQVQEIKASVDANTKQGAITSQSVDSLTMVVLDLQIAKAESLIVELEAAKQIEGSGWSKREERELRDYRRALRQLTAQRDILFQRVMGRMQ